MCGVKNTALFCMENKICPKCKNRKFFVIAHVAQEWEVDEKGNFLECTNECLQVTHSPDDDDLWRCAKCGFEAQGGNMKI